MFARLLFLSFLFCVGLAGSGHAAPSVVDLKGRFCHAVTDRNVSSPDPAGFSCTGVPRGYEKRRLWLRTDLRSDGLAPAGTTLVVHQSRFDRMTVVFGYADGATYRHEVRRGGYGGYWRVGGQIAFEAPPRRASLETVTLAVDRLAAFSLLRARLMPSDVQRRDATVAAALVGGAMTLLALSAGYNLLLFLASRRQFIAWHAAWVGCVLVWGLLWSQLALLVVPEVAGTSASKICTMLSTLAIACATACAATCFEPGALPRRGRGILIGLGAVVALLGVPVAFAAPGTLMIAGTALSAVVLADLAAVMAAIVWAWRRGSRAARDFAFAWTLPMMVLALTDLIDFGASLFGGGAQFAVLLASATQTIWLSVATTLRLAALRAERDAARADQAELRELSIRDPLTGLLNRRGFVAQAQHALGEAGGGRASFALLLLDVDHFKTINDRYGHDIGDRVLQRITDYLRHLEGRAWFTGRLGGEEFGIGIPGLSRAALKDVAEKVRSGLGELGVQDLLDDGGRLTVSVGAALAVASEGFDTLYRRADQALYAAKRAGRNRVALSSERNSAPGEIDVVA